MSHRTPSYRLHRPTGLAVVTIDGRDVYLGKHGTPESRAEYDRQIARWLANGRRGDPRSDASVVELMARYVRHADSYYVKDGRPTGEPGMVRLSLRPLARLYGDTPAKDFGPTALKAVRQAHIDAGLCRNEVNRRAQHVVRFFRWCVENELVPSAVLHALKAVPGLKRGRCDVRESEPVRAVADAAVDAIRPHVSRQVWAMVELQRLTGMRPGEAILMRTMDLDVTGPVWEYVPGRHKTEHHGRERRVYLGPKAQEVVRPWLRADLAAYLFSPAEAEAERMGRPARPGLGARYTVRSYHKSIARGCDRAHPHPTLEGVAKDELTPDRAADLKEWRRAHRWHPNRLRHNAATRLRREFGLDVARVILGHSSPAVTEVYAEVDRAKAVDVMGRVG
jgi:site-specific recombinase XerD